MKVAVVGGAGYVGGELLRLIQAHPEVTEWVATSRSQAGKPVSDVHPALAVVTDARFAADAPAEAARGRDVVFLCLEHGESSRISAEVLEARPGLVVDLAADFRIRDPELHAKYYGTPPEGPVAARFTYALADIVGAELLGQTALAIPGCYATAAQLALYPLRDLKFAAPPALFAVTGSSGAGAKPKATTHHPARAHNLFAYSAFGHRHEGEILEQWRRWTGQPDARARLLTHSGPFVRGIHLSLYAVLADDAVLPTGGVGELLRAAYEDRPFVRVVAEPPQLTHVVGTNLAILHAAESDDGREIHVLAVIDNLVKGAAGQAVQAMNLALGFSETAGLVSPAPFPI